jgi:Tol biopolymer transport system component
MKLTTLIFSVLLIFGTAAGQTKNGATKFLNQEPPAMESKLFAPEIISLKNRYEFGSVFSKDGKEFYFAVEENNKPEIWFSRFENSVWTDPIKLIFSDKYGYNDPFLSPDEKKLFFISDRPLDGKGDKKDIDIWYAERTSNGWSEPVNAGPKINSVRNEYYISFTSKGVMYFSSNAGTGEADNNNFDIYTSDYATGTFQTAKKLSGAINTTNYEADVFVSPNEEYIIYCSERQEGLGKGDLYISFKDKNGAWKEAKNMGSVVNSPAYEFCPFVSPDGKYLFFTRSGEIYWVSTKILDTFK